MTRPSTMVEAWPRLLRPEQAAAYVGEKSVESFRRAIPRLYPEPVRIPGKGDRWLKETLDEAIDRLTGLNEKIKDASDVL